MSKNNFSLLHEQFENIFCYLSKHDHNVKNKYQLENHSLWFENIDSRLYRDTRLLGLQIFDHIFLYVYCMESSFQQIQIIKCKSKDVSRHRYYMKNHYIDSSYRNGVISNYGRNYFYIDESNKENDLLAKEYLSVISLFFPYSIYYIKKHKVLLPLPITFKEHDNYCLASFVPANINGSDETKEASIEYLRDALASTVRLYNKHETQLSPYLQNNFKILREHIEC